MESEGDRCVICWLGDLPLPTFGRPVGVIVNYTPDNAVRFDLSGQPIEVLDHAHRIGEAQFFFKGMGRPLSRDELDAFFGGNKTAKMPQRRLTGIN